MHQYLLKTARYVIKYLLWQKIKLWLNFIQAELEVLFFKYQLYTETSLYSVLSNN